MAGFIAAIGPSAPWQPDVSYDLPDELDPQKTRITVQFMHFKATNNATFEVRAPATGTVHVPKTTGSLSYVEIRPLPFWISSEVRKLPGIPTFYLAVTPWKFALAEDNVVEAGEILADAAVEAHIGVVFQDRVTLAPQRWLEMLAKISPSWQALTAFYAAPGHKTVRLLDHAGFPLQAQQDKFECQDASGSPCAPVGYQGSELTLPATAAELKWKGDPLGSDEALPVMSFYETGASAPPGEWVTLPDVTGPWHAQVLDLSRWFSKPRPGVTTARYRAGCHFEPIVDGLPTFHRLIDDFLACAHPDHGAHLAGWVFKDITLDPERSDTKLTKLIQEVWANGGDVRLLVNQYLTLKKDAYGQANVNRIALAPAMVSLSLAPGLAALFASVKKLGLETDLRGFVCLATASALAMALFGGIVATGKLSVSDILAKAFEQSKDFVDAIEAFRKNVAAWDSYPPRFADNPLAQNPPWVGPVADLADAIDQVGNWHQKFQIFKIKNNGASQYVAYTGGIDFDENRLDSPGHQVWGPFHDVQARVLGPAVTDFCRTFSDRYQRLKALTPTLNPEVFPVPAPPSLPAQPAKHLVQVGRTLFQPAGKPDSGQPLAFAPNGDSTTTDTLIRAVQAAKEYIYIEDQYFTPNERSMKQDAQTLVDALLEAASHCRRLLVLVPDETDQTYGDVRRRYLFSKLAAAWSKRFMVGTILRRPLLSVARLSASEGRCVLVGNVSAIDSVIGVAPPARVPAEGPFWLWVDGELMRSQRGGVYDPFTSSPSLNVAVERGLFGATKREHKDGAAVTISQLKGIYVHSKLMIVDDVFVSIGSANLNRRGLYHDGEIGVFCIPEQLKAAPDNPARSLRTALWAEHLGLAPSVGAALLSDPIAGFDLFAERRDVFGRFAPFAPIPPDLSIAFPPTGSILSMLFGITIAAWETPQERNLWDVVIDPTGYADPDWTSGPLPD